jgi:peptidase S24-like
MSDKNDRLVIFREYLHLNQTGIAQKIGIHQRNWSRYENGDVSVPDSVLLKLSELGLNLHWYHTGVGDMILSTASKDLPALKQNNVETKIPLLRQRVSCGPGQDWESEDNIIDYIDIFNISRVKINRLFALRVEGTSMIGAGIQSGDYVLFDGTTDQRVRDGLYVFALDGDVYCKRLEFDMRKIKIFSVRHFDLEKAELMETLDMRDMSSADRLTIFGRVLYWIHPCDQSLHKA